MLRLKSINITNFRSIQTATISFENQGLISIVGDNQDDNLLPSNGAGKTTLLSAISWNLFGVTINGKAGDDILSWADPKNCRIESTWDKDGVEGVITRHRKHKEHANDTLFTIGGRAVDFATNKDAQRKIEEWLGFNEDVFNTILVMGCTAKTYKPFLLMTDGEKKEFTDKILNLEYLNTALANVKTDLSKNNDAIQQKSSQIQAERTVKAELENQIIEYQQQAKDFESRRAGEVTLLKDKISMFISDAKVMYADIEKQKEELEQIIIPEQIDTTAYDVTSEKLKIALAEEKETKSVIESKTKIVHDLELKIANIIITEDEYKAEYDHTKDIIEKQKELTKFNKSETILTTKIKDSFYVQGQYSEEDHAKLAEIKKDISDLTANLNIQSKELAKYKLLLENAVDKPCEMCGQIVKATEDVCNHYRAKVDMLNLTVTRLTVRLQDRNKQYDNLIVELEIAYKKLYDATIAALESEVTYIQAKIITATEVITQYENQFIEFKQQITPTLKMRKASNVQLAIDEFRKAIQENSDKLNRLEASILSLNETTAILKKEIDANILAIQQATSDYKEKKQAITNSSALYKNLLKDIDAYKIQVKSKENEQNTFDTIINKNSLAISKKSDIIKKLEAEIASLIEKNKLLNFWVDGFGSSGLKSYILDSVCTQLNTVANNCLQKLSNDLSVRFVTQELNKSGDIRDKFTVIIKQADIETTFDELSKGEKARVSISVNRALKALAESYRNVKINFEFYDEALDGLDFTGCQQVINYLRETLSQYESIFVISHDSNLKPLFDINMVAIKQNKITKYIIDEG